MMTLKECSIRFVGFLTLEQHPPPKNLTIMFKPTQPLCRRLRRLALTTKQVNGGYYKGTGSGSMGKHTKHGGFIIDWRKVRTYVVPNNLGEFKVCYLKSILPGRRYADVNS